jgi:hypothetical protein
LYCKEALLVLEYGLFDCSAGFKPQDLAIVYLSLSRKSQSGEVIGDTKALFSRHDTESLVIGEFIGLIIAKELALREHTLPVCLREDSVATDILERMEAESIALYRHYYLSDLISRD